MKKQVKKQSIGILGGMGPQASARLLNLMIEMSIRDFMAKNGDDFPEIILDSVPIQDFISNKKNEDKALEMLRSRTKKLNKFDLSCLAIACNTAHILLPELQVISKTPFISIIEEVSKAVDESKLRKVGILGTSQTIKSGLYQKSLEKLDIKINHFTSGRHPEGSQSVKVKNHNPVPEPLFALRNNLTVKKTV